MKNSSVLRLSLLLLAMVAPEHILCAGERDAGVSLRRSSFGDEQARRLLAVAAESEGTAWYSEETENFRIFICCPSSDRQRRLGRTLERMRRQLREYCQLEAAPAAWEAKCVVVFHPTPESYAAQVSSAAAGSWGRALVTRSRQRVVRRRIDLCATSWRRVSETLTHELAHVVLADAFPAQPAPRWLDEGLAVHVEPSEKFRRRARFTAEPGEKMPLLPAASLLHTSEYPGEDARHAFYTESGQLVRLLLELDDVESLIRFTTLGEEKGYAHALTAVYGVSSFQQLDHLRERHATGSHILQASYR